MNSVIKRVDASSHRTAASLSTFQPSDHVTHGFFIPSFPYQRFVQRLLPYLSISKFRNLTFVVTISHSLRNPRITSITPLVIFFPPVIKMFLIRLPSASEHLNLEEVSVEPRCKTDSVGFLFPCGFC